MAQPEHGPLRTGVEIGPLPGARQRRSDGHRGGAEALCGAAAEARCGAGFRRPADPRGEPPRGDAPETFATLAGIDWERDATGGHEEASAKAHGRIERRRIRTLTPLRGTVSYPHLKQIFRVGRQRIDASSGHESRELAYGITSVPEERGSPEQLLAWNRGHWAVENQNHRTRDVHCAEDACLARKAHAPVNNALCNCIALAIILRRGKSVAEATRHFALHRNDALDAVLLPA